MTTRQRYQELLRDLKNLDDDYLDRLVYTDSVDLAFYTISSGIVLLEMELSDGEYEK